MTRYATVDYDAPRTRDETIKLHPPEAFKGMRAAGRLAAEALDMLAAHVRPGVATDELNDRAHAFLLERGAWPAPLNYRGFPKSICTSVNHVVCHGIPGPKRLADGDILNIDVTCVLDGWHGDTSRMFAVGTAPVRARRLIDITFEAMWLGIRAARPGGRLGDIGHAIQRFAEANRCSVVKDFCGHGLGRLFHDAPNVIHAGKPGTGPELKPGMFFTIEPMINLGRPDVKILDDGWTAVTRDRQLSAQFEHTVGITEDGVEVFTVSPAGLERPVWG